MSEVKVGGKWTRRENGGSGGDDGSAGAGGVAMAVLTSFVLITVALFVMFSQAVGGVDCLRPTRHRASVLFSSCVGTRKKERKKEPLWEDKKNRERKKIRREKERRKKKEK